MESRYSRRKFFIWRLLFFFFNRFFFLIVNTRENLHDSAIAETVIYRCKMKDISKQNIFVFKYIIERSKYLIRIIYYVLIRYDMLFIYCKPALRNI